MMSATTSTLHGRAIIDTLHRARVQVVVSVPDICTSESVLRPVARDPALRLVRVCKEDEGVSICAALSVCGVRAVLLMQQTGLLDSMNALRAVGVDYRNPVCMMVGMLGKEPDVAPSRSARSGVFAVEPMLDALGVSHRIVDVDADLEDCVVRIESAYRQSLPLALLLGRDPR
jgi:sulfopyruvate decarboxylase subunit beta